MGYAPQFNAYQARWFYVVDGLTHRINAYLEPVDFNKAPGDVASAYGVYNNNQAQNTFVNVADGMWGALDDIYDSTDAQFGICELWKASSDSQNWTFLTSYNSSVAPIATAGYIPAAETIFTFRTIGGTVMRFHLEETASNAQPPLIPNVVTPANVLDAFAAHVIDDLAWYRDRHGSRPFAALRYFRGQNEAIFKRRYRQ